MNIGQPMETRREVIAPSDRFRAGVLNPIGAVAVDIGEGGMLSQSVMLELDPIAGNMKSAITAEFIAVFVPIQAIHAIKYPEANHAGLTEVIRMELTEGNPVFEYENEGVISERCGVNPIAIGDDRKVNEMVRLAHNAAVNHLRLEKYHKATLILGTNTAVTPALLSSTILDRMNGVLDPDDRINGSVQLSLPAMKLPVDNVAFHNATGASDIPTTGAYTNTDDGSSTTATGKRNLYLSDSGLTDLPRIFATLNATTAGDVALSDFYNAETRDKLTRQMDEMIRENPQYGVEMVVRWAHGLNVDTGKTCFVMHREERQFGNNIVDAMDSDGVLAETLRSDMGLTMRFTAPIPRTELGGVVITFVTVKPDERIRSMPHPIFAYPWGAKNYAADSLQIDPIPVTMRELDSDVAAGSQSTISMYTGLNALKKAYVNYGYTRNFNTSTVEAKTSVWQLDLPLSVTPDTILYPANIPQYPWVDNNAEICRYDFTSVATLRTPMVFGPTPVEEIQFAPGDDPLEE